MPGDGICREIAHEGRSVRLVIPILSFTLIHGTGAFAGVCDSGRDTQKVLCRGTNQIRAENGVGELREDAHLDRMADD